MVRRALRSSRLKYHLDEYDRAKEATLIRIWRGTTDPRAVLDELRHIARAIEGKAGARARLRKRAPSPEDMWSILDGLSGTGWYPVSITQTCKARVAHWHLSTSFSVLVESALAKPGFAGYINCWSRRGGRNLLTRVAASLRENGYRRLDPTHYQRWQSGLDARGAARQVELLEETMRRLKAAR